LKIEFRDIGIIRTPHKETRGMPIQPAGAGGIRGTVEIFPQFEEGVKDLEGFSHIVLLYNFHKAGEARLTVTPFLDTKPRGVFATRAPSRPNPIGLSVVALRSVEGNVLHIENVDILDGTPLLDIKPYIPDFDGDDVIRTGWYEKHRGKVEKWRSDKRFE